MIWEFTDNRSDQHKCDDTFFFSQNILLHSLSKKHSWLSGFAGSASADPAKYGLKIFGTNIASVLNMFGAYFFLVIIPYTIQYNDYLHRIYIALAIISNLQIDVK